MVTLFQFLAVEILAADPEELGVVGDQGVLAGGGVLGGDRVGVEAALAAVAADGEVQAGDRGEARAGPSKSTLLLRVGLL